MLRLMIYLSMPSLTGFGGDPGNGPESSLPGLVRELPRGQATHAVSDGHQEGERTGSGRRAATGGWTMDRRQEGEVAWASDAPEAKPYFQGLAGSGLDH